MKSKKITIKILKNTLLWCLTAFLLLGISNCGDIEENDLDSQNCTTGCTIIHGRLTTNDRKSGIGNAKLILKWAKRYALFNGTIRKKAIVRTNNDGTFEFEFRINDDELYEGSYEIEYFVDESKFLILYGRTIHLGSLDRDTIVDFDYLIPLKAYIKWEVLNNKRIKNDEYFHTKFQSPIGLMGYEGGSEVNWSEPPLEPTIEVAGNQPIYLRNTIKKDGIRIEKIDTITIAAGETIPYSFDFLE